MPDDPSYTYAEAISAVESAINTALIVVGHGNVALRKALLDARGNIREAIGEART